MPKDRKTTVAGVPVEYEWSRLTNAYTGKRIWVLVVTARFNPSMSVRAEVHKARVSCDQAAVLEGDLLQVLKDRAIQRARYG